MFTVWESNLVTRRQYDGKKLLPNNAKKAKVPGRASVSPDTETSPNLVGSKIGKPYVFKVVASVPTPNKAAKTLCKHYTTYWNLVDIQQRFGVL